MTKSLSNFLKLAISLGLGIFICWLTTHNLTAEQIQVIKNAFKNTNYFWVILGPLIGMLSNIVRAERWRMLLNAAGYKPKFLNVVNSIFVMYAGNIIFPRLGEVTRCSLLYKTDGVPIDKSIGTMVVERIIDLVTMLLLGVLVIFFQFDILFDFFQKNILSHYANSFSGLKIWGIFAILIAVGLGSFYFLYTQRNHAILGKFWSFLMGVKNGLISVTTLENPLLFIFHSILIWALYCAMMYACIFALPETKNLTIWACMACVFFGGFAFILSPGGIGAYPATIMALLVLYNIPAEIGFAFGWLVWTLQTSIVIVCGIISFLLISRNFTFQTPKTT